MGFYRCLDHKFLIITPMSILPIPSNRRHKINRKHHIVQTVSPFHVTLYQWHYIPSDIAHGKQVAYIFSNGISYKLTPRNSKKDKVLTI